jgi:hypothetical protein
MKMSLPGIIICVLLAGGSFLLRAQTNTNVPPPSPQTAREAGMISFLTPAQQEQYAQARAKVLGDNPKLKTEGEDLIKQGNTVMATGTKADRQAFIEEMNSHRQKLRQAMLKVDPTLEPIFAEIDKHISEMKAKHLSQVQSSSSPTNASTAGPTNR